MGEALTTMSRVPSKSLALTNAVVLTSTVIIALIIVSGVAYAWSNGDDGGVYSPPNLALQITSMSETGPSHIAFTHSSLPASTATFRVGPFAPADTITVYYTVKNTGNTPASLSSFGVSVSPSGNGFTATNGVIPSSLNPGASFSSTITIMFGSGLGNSYEGRTATITLSISGVGITTTTSCAAITTQTTTKTVTTTKTATVTTTKTVTKDQDSPLSVTALWTTTSSCTTMTVTISTTLTTTQTTTITKTVTVTPTCTKRDSCK